MKFRVQNVGGVRDLTIDMKPGVNVLTGRNGAGKSSAIRAISRAAGGDDKLEVRDGCERGTVDGPGVHLTIRQVVRESGRAEVELADTGALAQLIDPGIADSDAANRARQRALLKLVRLPVTDENVQALAGGDEDVFTTALHRIREKRVNDLLDAAEAVRLAGHDLARGSDRTADLQALTEQTAGHAVFEIGQKLQAVGGATSIPAAIVAQQVNDLSLELVRKQEALRGRNNLESQQAAVRAEIGERPDLEAHEAEAARLLGQDRGVAAAIAERETELAGLRAEHEAILRARVTVGRQIQIDREELKAWERRRELLDQPVEGPTLEDVVAAESQLDHARQVLEAARLSAELAGRKDEAARALAAAEAARVRSAELREVATTVGERLGELLAGTDAAGLTVVAGRLCAVVDGEPRDFATRLSDGERVAAALRVAARCYRGSVVPLDPAFWGALDEANKSAFASVAAELGLFCVTEAATEGSEVRVEHIGLPVPILMEAAQ